MANKITGATRVTEQDIKNIEVMSKAGLKPKQIVEITGWSTPVVSKICNGTYYELNAKKREYENAKNAKKRESVVQSEQNHRVETMVRPTEPLVEDFDSVSLKKVLMELNKQLAFIILNMKGRV